MFNFKKQIPQPKEGAVMERPRSNNQVVEEIHETFFTEVDRLLSEAKVSHSLETDKQGLINKCNRLTKLGFSKSKEVIEAQTEINRLNVLEQKNKEKQSLVSAINYFSNKYPQYKFITEESVKKICSKYGLIYGGIGNYIGIVPDKNLKHIEDFKIKSEDECYNKKKYDMLRDGYHLSSCFYFGAKEKAEYDKNEREMYKDKFYLMQMSRYSREESGKEGLEICAPKTDFDLKGMEVKDNMISKVIPPDPIVLCPVHYGGQKHYLVVTAWGIEASDENIVNEKMN